MELLPKKFALFVLQQPTINPQQTLDTLLILSTNVTPNNMTLFLFPAHPFW